ncbi:MAG: ATP-grasp domain-containing protein, partial [bacterium]|nr:ATP-grasp domain-containing protein [bacterium]
MMKLGICYNLKQETALTDRGEWCDDDAEYEDRATIDALVDGLQAYSGNAVVRLPCDRNLPNRLASKELDLVFNIGEGWGGRNREAYAPTLFEIYNIPYTGSDGLTLSLTLDKVLAKKIMEAEGLPTPAYFVARNLADLKECSLPFPLFVKPCHEGTSKGIRNFSKVHNRAALERVVEWVVTNYHQPALIERFIHGTEWAVSIMGNGLDCQVLPLAEIRFTDENPFYSFECKTLVDERVCCPASVDPALGQKIEEIALRTYRLFGCRDFARLDFRIDETGEPYIIEVNPLPGLSTRYSLFPIQAAAAGLEYRAMIGTIVEAALKRNGKRKNQMGPLKPSGKNGDRLWKDQIRNRVRDVEELSQYLHLDPNWVEWFKNVGDTLPFSITPYLLSIADRKNPACPIRRQFLPSPQELKDPYGEDDPLLEENHLIAPGLIQVYADRAAWTTSSFCPSLCRHCLRRNRFQSSHEEGVTPNTIGAVLQAVSDNTEIRDILLTGGDPLAYDNDFLEDLL